MYYFNSKNNVSEGQQAGANRCFEQDAGAFLSGLACALFRAAWFLDFGEAHSYEGAAF